MRSELCVTAPRPPKMWRSSYQSFQRWENEVTGNTDRTKLTRCAVLLRFSEHWRRWHSSDIRQRRTARATIRSCRLVYVDVDATFRTVPSLFYQLFILSKSPSSRSSNTPKEYQSLAPKLIFKHVSHPPISSPNFYKG